MKETKAQQSWWIRRYERDPRKFGDDARWLFLGLVIAMTAVYWPHHAMRANMLSSAVLWAVYLPIRTYIRIHYRTPSSLVWTDALSMVVNMYWWKWLPVSAPLLSVAVVWEAAWSLPVAQAFWVSILLGVGYAGAVLWPPALPHAWDSIVFVAPFYTLFAVLLYLLRRQLGYFETLAGTDYLTGLPNRRQLLESYQKSPQAGLRSWVVIFDMDNFKQINDRFGHIVGDMVLRDFGRILRQLFRTGELTARYGGEEFLVVLPLSVSSAALKERLARINYHLQDLSLHYPTPVTVSAGVAQSWHDGEPLMALIARADEALYQAKARGKNQAVWSASTSTP
ncbi:MAG: hypothetical protein C7B44_01035 [Sulfobacillus thermosulfidooxidans]|nr:MAG: hypothetical protein C7B44_01035 [Sulfobacillus thermosulfidooxidans]